jgi:hypothetical protein
LGKNLTNEREIHQKELEDNEIIQPKESNEISRNNVQTSNVTILDNEHQNNLEENENITNLPNNIHINIYDPSQWKNIDTKLRDLLVEKDPIRDNDLNFPKDENSRHFTMAYYIQKLPNGEKCDRKWLMYSKDLDKVYCFCCILFNSKGSTSQLANEGTNECKNLSFKLKTHETTKSILLT